jgi:hypothetical protein
MSTPADSKGLTVHFTTAIEQTGTNTTGIPVPEAVVEGLGGGKRAAVVVTVAGHTYRSSLASMGGQAMISLSAENRSLARVAGGDEVEVEIALDTQPRQVTIPPDLAAALEGNPAARTAFERLSYSKQRWHVLNVEGAKAVDTRQRRVAKSIEILIGTAGT